jgi:hypothetical protein
MDNQKCSQAHQAQTRTCHARPLGFESPPLRHLNPNTAHFPQEAWKSGAKVWNSRRPPRRLECRLRVRETGSAGLPVRGAMRGVLRAYNGSAGMESRVGIRRRSTSIRFFQFRRDRPKSVSKIQETQYSQARCAWGGRWWKGCDSVSVFFHSIRWLIIGFQEKVCPNLYN